MEIHVDAEGNMKPAAIEWADGRKYVIDKVISERMSPPPHVGAILARRYDVMVEGREKTIFLETASNRWFVEKPRYD